MRGDNFCLGIIGFGGMAEYHFKRAPEVPNFIATAVFDVDPAALEKAKDFGMKAYTTAEQLLSDPEIDVVLVATPNDLHCEYAIMAMAVGKHVVCEKPVCMNSDELAKMIEASKKYNKIFTVHQNRRWDDDFLAALAVLKTGQLGNVFSIESRVQGSRGIPGEWRQFKEQGGGMVLDWGVHLIDQMLMMHNKKVTQIYVRMQHVNYDQVDDGFKVFITFEDGLSAYIEVCTSCFVNLPRWHISGDNGTLVLNNFKAQDGKIVCKYDPQEKVYVEAVNTGAGKTVTMAPRTEAEYKTFDIPQVVPDWTEFYKNVLAAIKGEEALLVKPEQAMRVMLVMEAMFKSEAENKAVEVSI